MGAAAVGYCEGVWGLAPKGSRRDLRRNWSFDAVPSLYMRCRLWTNTSPRKASRVEVKSPGFVRTIRSRFDRRRYEKFRAVQDYRTQVVGNAGWWYKLDE